MKKKGMFILSERAYNMVYRDRWRPVIEDLIDVQGDFYPPELVAKDTSILKDVQIIMSGWGCIKFEPPMLEALPNLEAVFYGAGSIRGFTTPAFWDRNIIITSAYAANAIPVAEYCAAAIIFSLKLGWRFMYQIKQEKAWPQRGTVPGAYRSTVGLVSLGMIAQKTLELLKPYELDIVVYSTSLTEERAREMGVRRVDLDELFRISDVVSLHTPDLPATRDMINKKHFESMKSDATFLNTARGRVVNEPEMIEVLKKRPDITALLDVTYPEPPEQGSPLYELPNVFMTPHTAGSLDRECERMGEYAVNDLRSYLEGKPMAWQISREAAERMA